MNLNHDLYVDVTSAGAYYAVSSGEPEMLRQLIFQLLQSDQSPQFSEQNIDIWSNNGNPEETIQMLYRLQELGWITGLHEPVATPTGAVDAVLPKLLPTLSEDRKILLADSEGFYVASFGYPHEAAEELSAVSADLAILYNRHKGLLQNNQRHSLQSWGLIDAAGNSQLGFWPLCFGKQRFVLVLSGRPCFNQPAFKDLVWSLARRYIDNDWSK